MPVPRAASDRIWLKTIHPLWNQSTPRKVKTRIMITPRGAIAAWAIFTLWNSGGTVAEAMDAMERSVHYGKLKEVRVGIYRELVLRQLPSENEPSYCWQS